MTAMTSPRFSNAVVSFLALATLAGAAAAQPMPVERRTFGLLASDTQLEAIFLLRDFNGNGTATDVDETTVYVDATNLSGEAQVSGNVFAIVQAIDGSVYVGEGDSDTVYRVRDLNGDGDAQDKGEVVVWFRSTPEFPIPSPNGIGFDSTGAVYILTAGVASIGVPTAVFRTVDTDGDGTATGAGEVTLWLDAPALIGASTPFELSFIGDVAHFGDLRGGAADAIIRAHDADGDHTISAGELNVFIEDGNPFGVPCSFSAASDGVALYVHESTASVSPQRLFRLEDLNSNTVIDAAEETREMWNELRVPAGLSFANSFAIAVGPPGMMAVSSNGSETQDNVYLLRDLDGSGDFLQQGETTAFQQGNADGFAENVRAIQFIAPPGCAPDWNHDGTVNSQDFFDFLAGFFNSNADYNGDGVTNSQDFFDFLSGFFAGC
jgi:hypothetical protein